MAAIPELKYRMLLTTIYATGLRASEALHLQVSHIDSRRKTVRVRQGKGHKDRYVMLSAKLLLLLRRYWKVAQPARRLENSLASTHRQARRPLPTLSERPPHPDRNPLPSSYFQPFASCPTPGSRSGCPHFLTLLVLTSSGPRIAMSESGFLSCSTAVPTTSGWLHRAAIGPATCRALAPPLSKTPDLPPARHSIPISFPTRFSPTKSLRPLAELTPAHSC